MATLVNLSLVDKTGADQASLSGLYWAWYDTAPWTNTSVTYTDAGTTEATDVNGAIEITLVSSTKLDGETGWLALYDPVNSYYGLYNLAVTVV